MRTLVIYFSWSGNNRVLAEALVRRLGADICEVVEEKRRNGLTIALDLLFRRKPAIQPLACTPARYEHVILVAPIWASQVAHPMQTLLREQASNITSFSFITFCGNGPASQLVRIEKQLTRSVGRAPLVVEQLPLAERLPEAERKKPGSVTHYRATADDVQHFEQRIENFCDTIAGSEPRASRRA